jgi:4'-phosphopantetheinyl transferase EntD
LWHPTITKPNPITVSATHAEPNQPSMSHRDILPAGVFYESLNRFEDACPLLEEERVLVQNAVEKRVHEFTAGRHCARLALRKLGVLDFPILRGARNAPIWPKEIVGSITHCPGFASAVVCPSSVLLGVGIDTEIAEPLPVGISETIITSKEQQLSADLPRGVAWDRVIFSAKESLFKLWYPLTGSWLDFHDAHIFLDPGEMRFSVEILIPHHGFFSSAQGRVHIAEGLIFTSVFIQQRSIDQPFSMVYGES